MKKVKLEIENYKIFIDGKPLGKVKKHDYPKKSHKPKKKSSHYFRRMNWEERDE